MNWINLQNVMKFLENERDVLTKTTLGDLYDVYAQLPKEFSPWNMRHQIIHDIFAYAFGKLTYNDIKGDLTEPFTEEIMRSIIKSLELDVELSRYEIGLCTYGESSRMYVDVYNKEDRITLLFLISLDNKISGIWLHEKGKITKLLDIDAASSDKMGLR